MPDAIPSAQGYADEADDLIGYYESIPLAVWMHLDEREREISMPALASLLAPEGVMILSLRHGPAPAGRRMFDVSGKETIALARKHGLRAVLSTRAASVQAINRQAGVTWSRVALQRASNLGS